ncbi:UNVERIFIED_CONTAM: hypothetical protein K2H54_007106 [Gekko kuhli]
MVAGSALPNDNQQKDELTINRQELVEIHKDLHCTLREAVEELIQPVNTQLADFMTELRETAKKRTLTQQPVSRFKKRSNDRILKEARLKGNLLYKEKKILVLLDLSAETLEKRKSLKLFSSKLYDGKIRFRWSPSSDIIVYKNGVQLLVYDTSSGKDLLKACGIQITPEEDKLLAK